MSVGLDCWAHCRTCGTDFTLGCVVPCPLEVYVAALTVARCPHCGESRTAHMHAYSPGMPPRLAPQRVDAGDDRTQDR